jgi:membrane protein implicated in regulation of membrane protease activity
MKKRIIAWILLAGFVMLLLNLIVFRFYWQLSMVVYIIIVIVFILTNGKLFETQVNEGNENPGNNHGNDVVGGAGAAGGGKKEEDY